jgi:RHS repeat-associated protein
MKEGTEYYFYHNDHLGTPQKMTAINGAVVWGANYESFGKASVDGSLKVTNNLRYPGQYFDQETGLHYNFYRYYDPVSGRYFRIDPIGLISIIMKTDAINFGKKSVNMYLYANNNTVSFIDPLGLKDTTYAGWEAQFVIGGGEIMVECCTDGRFKENIIYKKACFGAGFDISASGGKLYGLPDDFCENPPMRFVSGEFSIPILWGIFGIEGGISIDTRSGEFGPSLGGNIGYGGKATACLYWYSDREYVRRCTCEEASEND